MSNGFEINSKCPLVYLKDQFFKDKVCFINYLHIYFIWFVETFLIRKPSLCIMQLSNANRTTIEQTTKAINILLQFFFHQFIFYYKIQSFISI